MKISASFLAIEDDIYSNIRKLDQVTLVDYIHVDIMDGVFAGEEDNSDFKTMERLLFGLNNPLDIHLMVEDLDLFVNNYGILSPEIMTIHYEAHKNIKKYLLDIRSKGIKAGLSIKPDTDISDIEQLLKYTDLVLVMSVNPGAGGQEFIKNSENKIKELVDLRKSNKLKYLIQVDGGINDETISYCSMADIVVVGSYITKEENYENQVRRLKGLEIVIEE